MKDLHSGLHSIPNAGDESFKMGTGPAQSDASTASFLESTSVYGKDMRNSKCYSDLGAVLKEFGAVEFRAEEFRN